jgi:hypothetical protein
MDITRRDIKVLVETCRRNGMTAVDTHAFITKAWGQSATSLSNVYHLFREFKDGAGTFDDNQRAGRPCSSSTTENVDKIKALLDADNTLSIRRLESITSIPRSTVSRIIHENLGLRLVKVRWVPHALSTENKEERISLARQLLRLLSSPAIVKHEKVLVIIDEKMLYHSDRGNESTNKAWMPPGEERPPRQKRLQIDPKSMIVVAVTSDGRYHYEVLHRGEMMTGERYKQFLMHMEYNFHRHANPLDWSRIVLMHDNARPHTCKLVTDFLSSHSVVLAKQPAWSPDYNMLDRYVFPAMENARCGHDFADESAIHDFLAGFLRDVCANSFATQLPLLQMDLEDIITSGGDYLPE